jgi:Pin2-interacting protein X1
MEVELKDTLNSTWKNDKSGFGYKMLQKMGWKEDVGLGKNATGITSNIKLKRREEGLGLGMEKQTDGAGNKGWSQTTSSFNDVLALLKDSYGKAKASKKSKKEKEKLPKSSTSISVGMK